MLLTEFAIFLFLFFVTLTLQRNLTEATSLTGKSKFSWRSIIFEKRTSLARQCASSALNEAYGQLAAFADSNSSQHSAVPFITPLVTANAYKLSGSANNEVMSGINSDSSSISADVNVRSICQWSWYHDHDPNRIPQHLAQAKCSTASSTVSYECWPVYYEFPVIKLTDGCSQKVEQHKISVACTAVLQAGVINNLSARPAANDFAQMD